MLMPKAEEVSRPWVPWPFWARKGFGKKQEEGGVEGRGIYTESVNSVNTYYYTDEITAPAKAI